MVYNCATFNSMEIEPESKQSRQSVTIIPPPQSGASTLPDSSDRPDTYQKSRKRAALRKYVLIAAAIVLAGLVAWQAFSFYQNKQAVALIPAAIRQSATFPLYAPDPADFTISPGTPSYGNSVFIYQTIPATPGSTDSYIVSQQAKPNGFNLAEYKTSLGMTDIKELTLPTGLAISGKVLSRTVLILVADQTLISISSTAQSLAQSHEQLARSLEAQKP